MHAFEFYFNPRANQERSCEIFIFEPKAKKDEKKGHLYFAVELRTRFPKSVAFLRRLSSIVRSEYYGYRSSVTVAGKKGAAASTRRPKKETSQLSEKALHAALKKANKFLQDEAKNGNVAWLGKLHAAVLAVVPDSEGDSSLYFAKYGDIQVWFSRNQRLSNIGRTLEDPAQDPNRPFGTIASGKIIPGDRILILSRELFDTFSRFQITSQLTTLVREEDIQKVFQSKEKEFAGIKGMFLFLSAEGAREQKPEVNVIENKYTQMAMDAATIARTAKLPSIPVKRLSLPAPQRFSAMGTKIRVLAASLFSPDLIKGAKNRFQMISSRTMFAAGAVLLLGVLGSILFQINQKSVDEEIEIVQAQVQELREQANNALIFKDTDAASEYLQEALSVLNAYKAEHGGVLPDELVFFEKQLQSKIWDSTNGQAISDVERIAELPTLASELVDARILATESSLFVVDKSAGTIFVVDNATKNVSPISISSTIKEVVLLDEIPLIIDSDNRLFRIEGSEIEQRGQLVLPNDFRISQGVSYAGNLYVVDAESGDIIFYQDVLRQFDNPQQWLSPDSRTAAGAQAFAIDGSLWVGLPQGEVGRFYRGRYQEGFTPELFPAIQRIARLHTSLELEYVYVLDSENTRFVVLSKTGAVISQYSSPELTNVVDFDISRDGTIFYVLDGSSVIQFSR